MKTIIHEVEKPSFKDLFSGLKSEKIVSGFGLEVLQDMILVGSGKGGISLILKYLAEKKY